MRWLFRFVALAVASALLPQAARSLPCPGDLDGDDSVSINEIITAVNSLLNGCAAGVCPGDLNGDDVVTVDEIIKAVDAALLGCAALPTPTPTVEHCPYTFVDDTLSQGASCGYAGPFSSNATCPTDLSALALGDGNLLAISIGSDPLITFGGVATSPTSATIIAYFLGDDLTPRPLSGVMQLSDDGATLVIDPDTVPDFNIGGVECSFDRYTGTFTQLVSDQARRATIRAALRLPASRGAWVPTRTLNRP